MNVGKKSSVTLTVFFCGTGGQLSPPTTQIGVFFARTFAPNITSDGKWLAVAPNLPDQLKMGFDGVGVTNGCCGMLFAVGLKAQCSIVIDKLDEIIAMGREVVLNCVGLSRGGIACLYLCQMAAKYGSAVTVNMCLFDPVPGNLLTTSRHVDCCCKLTAANDCVDLRQSFNLDRVLALYPHEPLPDLAFHAPVFPTYPAGANVEEDVILGCHQGALFNWKAIETDISKLRIGQFLRDVGTQLDQNLQIILSPGGELESSVLEGMQDQLRYCNVTRRFSHGKIARCIVRHEQGKFLNRHHQRLVERREQNGSEHEPHTRRGSNMYMLDLVRRAPVPTTLIIISSVLALCAAGIAFVIFYNTNK